MKSKLKLAALMILSMAGYLPAQTNLVQDCSFESDLRPWFAEHAVIGIEHGTNYFIGIQKVSDAVDGNYDLDIEGWSSAGSTILSPVVQVSGPTVSGQISARAIGTGANPTVELALYDSTGMKYSLGSSTLTAGAPGAWTTISATGVSIPSGTTPFTIAIVVSGAQHGMRVEVDAAGVFSGNTIGSVTDNNDTFQFPATSMTNNGGWSTYVTNYSRSEYATVPIATSLLNGTGTYSGLGTATYSVTANQSGPHNLWVHFLNGTATLTGSFTLSLLQGTTQVATESITTGSATYGSEGYWPWACLSIPAGVITAGTTYTIQLSRLPATAALETRLVDYVVLTNLTDYVPIAQDFGTRTYMRFTNRSPSTSFCEYFSAAFALATPSILNPTGPAEAGQNPYAGMLSHAGFSQDTLVPADTTKFLGPGESSPWVRISDYLDADGEQPYQGINRCQLTATTISSSSGFVMSGILGDIDFTCGDDRTTIKNTIHIGNPVTQMPTAGSSSVNMGARLLFTLPFDCITNASQILSGTAYYNAAALAASGLPYPTLSANTEVSTGLNFAWYDDRALVVDEIGLIKHLGMNNVDLPVTLPASELACINSPNGLLSILGGWTNSLLTINGEQFKPNVTSIAADAAAEATACGQSLSSLGRMKMADEPAAMTNAALFADSTDAMPYYNNFLTSLGVSPVGATIVPTTSKFSSPILSTQYYYTELFRLQTFANLVKTAQSVYHQYLLNPTLCNVNLSPPFGQTENAHGNDPFYLYRNGGVDMMWTEDWMGFGLGPQELSDWLALLNSAGSGPSSGPFAGAGPGTGPPGTTGSPIFGNQCLLMSKSATSGMHSDSYSALSNTSTSQMTITTWINTPSITGNLDIMMRILAANRAGYFNFEIVSGLLDFAVEPVDGVASSPAFSTATIPWTANQWTQIAMTFNAGVVTYYVNGVQLGNPITLKRSDNGVTITSIPATASTATVQLFNPGFVDGSCVDDFGYFGNTALTAANISSICTNGLQAYVSTLSPLPPSPNIFYYFEDQNKFAATDLSGGNFNLPYWTCKGTPLGGYTVPLDSYGVPALAPTIQRIKTYIWMEYGAQKINFYDYGPTYNGGDSWSTISSLFPTISSLGGEIAALDTAKVGASRTPRKIAILYNRTAQIWDDFADNTEQDSRYIYWALAHSGYDADFVAEEDVESGILSNYKVLYMDGVEVRHATATAIVTWVHGGGVLVGTAGAGTYDESHSSSTTLNPVFGATSNGPVDTATAGRPIYDTVNMTSLATMQATSLYTPNPSLTISALGITETLTVTTGQVLMTASTGGSGAVVNTYGSGKAYRLAFMPGLAYAWKALKYPGYTATNQLPGWYDQATANFITWPASQTTGVSKVVSSLTSSAPPVNSGQSLVTVVRWDGPTQSILYVIDYSGTANQTVTMTVPNTSQFTSASSARGASVAFTPSTGVMSFNLQTSDAIILSP